MLRLHDVAAAAAARGCFSDVNVACVLDVTAIVAVASSVASMLLLSMLVVAACAILTLLLSSLLVVSDAALFSQLVMLTKQVLL